MVTPVKGSVIAVRFPFSDLSQSKRRPVVVLANAERGDWVLCQITSNPYADTRAELLVDSDFASGSLQRRSYARPAKLFTAHENLMDLELGRLKPASLQRVLNAVIALFQAAR